MITDLIPAVLEAGRTILSARAGLTEERKADGSPVTTADRMAETILLAALERLEPGTVVVAEEAVEAGDIPRSVDRFFLVDALDGTKDYLNGRPDFTVNIGLVEGGVPIAGIVHAPASGRTWLGTSTGAFVLDDDDTFVPIKVRAPSSTLDIVASLSHRSPETDEFISRFPGSRVVAAGSSLKFCLLAEGKADLYPRLAPTCQWDTAAGDAVLRAAGGRVVTLEGQKLPYGAQAGIGKAAYLNPWFIATAGIDPFGEQPRGSEAV